LYRSSPLERISLIKRGIPASEVKNLFVDLHIGQGLGFKALNLSAATSCVSPLGGAPSQFHPHR
jgi:hypothetical protein